MLYFQRWLVRRKVTLCDLFSWQDCTGNKKYKNSIWYCYIIYICTCWLLYSECSLWTSKWEYRIFVKIYRINFKQVTSLFNGNYMVQNTLSLLLQHIFSIDISVCADIKSSCCPSKHIIASLSFEMWRSTFLCI